MEPNANAPQPPLPPSGPVLSPPPSTVAQHGAATSPRKSGKRKWIVGGVVVVLALGAIGSMGKPTGATGPLPSPTEAGGGLAAVATTAPTIVPTASVASTAATEPPTTAPTVEPTEEPTEAPTLAPTPDPTPEPTANPTPKPSYTQLSARAWAKLVKNPDAYIGDGIQIWACITQFDAATGTDTFRADAAPKKLGKDDYWLDGENAMFLGDEDVLADFVADDIVALKTVSLGSYSYDTQNGGNTTVPMFEVVTVKRIGGC